MERTPAQQNQYEINKRWMAENPEKLAASKRKWYVTKGREVERRGYLMRKYGLTQVEWDVMLERQGGVCAICGTDKWAGRHDKPHVDHDHRTGKVRGLLCNHCNLLLGRYEEALQEPGLQDYVNSW